MKLTKKILKEMIKEELLTERLKRFKVYVSGESEPLILMGKDIKDVNTAAKKPIDGQHRIEFESYPKLIFVDANLSSRVNKALENRIGLTERLE